jgi:hypothetical protein
MAVRVASQVAALVPKVVLMLHGRNIKKMV